MLPDAVKKTNKKANTSLKESNWFNGFVWKLNGMQVCKAWRNTEAVLYTLFCLMAPFSILQLVKYPKH